MIKIKTTKWKYDKKRKILTISLENKEKIEVKKPLFVSSLINNYQSCFQLRCHHLLSEALDSKGNAYDIYIIWSPRMLMHQCPRWNTSIAEKLCPEQCHAYNPLDHEESEFILFEKI